MSAPADEGCESTRVEIDSLLEDRNEDPVMDMPIRFDAAYENHVRTANSEAHRIPMTVEESVRVHADVYGTMPPHVGDDDERLAALEREICRIPLADRAALRKARGRNPVMFEASPHTRLLLRSEHFDAKDAARQLARYWQKREAMFGDRAFEDGVFTAPTYDDYLRYYDKCARAITDPDADDDTRAIAGEYVRCVHRTKIASLDCVLGEMARADPGTENDDNAATTSSILAEFQEKGVVISDETKLLFLRREDFIECNAAARIVKYWETKKALFGPDALYREITLGDINTDREGFIRLMPGTDHHGRTILAIFANALESDGWTDESVGQYFWYVIHAALERESCRKNGLVLLSSYRAGSKDLSEKVSSVRQLCRTVLFDCVPIKLRAAHVFFEPSAWWQWLLGSVFSKVSNTIQKRAVIHLGTGEKSLLEMEQIYGIAADQFPSELGGNDELDSWKAWLEERRSEGL